MEVRASLPRADVALESDQVLRGEIMTPHPGQDATMTPVFDVFSGVQPENDRNRLAAAIGMVHNKVYLCPDPQTIFQPDDVELFGAIKPKDFGIGAFLKLQGQNTHAHQVGTVNAFETFGHDGLD